MGFLSYKIYEVYRDLCDCVFMFSGLFNTEGNSGCDNQEEYVVPPQPKHQCLGK